MWWGYLEKPAGTEDNFAVVAMLKTSLHVI
jgi:hypothetical protein